MPPNLPPTQPGTVLLQIFVNAAGQVQAQAGPGLDAKAVLGLLLGVTQGIVATLPAPPPPPAVEVPASPEHVNALLGRTASVNGHR